MRYYKYSKHLKNRYGVKTYKIPVNVKVSCPNRDGSLGSEGCFYCGETGAVFQNTDYKKEIVEQINSLKENIAEKYNAEKFIAYFQNFSNTYLPLETLKHHIKKAASVEDVVEVCFSTRPDCINETYLREITEMIEENDLDVNFTLELGLQTVNYHTLKDINRRHTLGEFIDAVLTAHKYSIKVGVHLILNLPGDDRDDVIENAKVLSALKVDNVKLHALYIRENTQFAEMYKKGEIEVGSKEEYINKVITFLKYLSPDIAVQRLLGRAPEDKTLFVNWGKHWSQVHQMILNKMDRINFKQGAKFNYLDGKALKKFN
ncbi:MAG TPA: TIGR01212 family radical SAM protein [Halanaerobiales bacterium]|nr:TIGR01212 family radical SAM protein [Halanaerobiales bacterium]